MWMLYFYRWIDIEKNRKMYWYLHKLSRKFVFVRFWINRIRTHTHGNGASQRYQKYKIVFVSIRAASVATPKRQIQFVSMPSNGINLVEINCLLVWCVIAAVLVVASIIYAAFDTAGTWDS